MNIKKISFGNFKSLYNTFCFKGVRVKPTIDLSLEWGKRWGRSNFCDEVLKNKKHVFMTTDKPFVLDGLDLKNEDIRLFVADRNKKGYADIKKIQVSEQLINEGQPLSRIWISGRLEGVLD